MLGRYRLALTRAISFILSFYQRAWADIEHAEAQLLVYREGELSIALPLLVRPNCVDLTSDEDGNGSTFNINEKPFGLDQLKSEGRWSARKGMRPVRRDGSESA